MAMTPRLRSAALRQVSLTSAPRSLNELVTCRFSYLTKTSAPVSADRRGAGSIGVRNTCPAITRRASWISAIVTVIVSESPRSGRCFDPHISISSPCAAAVYSPLPGEVYWRENATLGGLSMSMDIKPHAYDPMLNPELFEGVLARRVIAFFIDFVVIAIPVVLAAMFIFAFGIVTLGLGWALYWLLPPASVIWAIIYFGASVGGARSATIGMRVMDLEMRTWYGAPAYFVLGAVHAIGFWLSVSALNPVYPASGLLQPAPPPAARHRARDRHRQQCRARAASCGPSSPAVTSVIL